MIPKKIFQTHSIKKITPDIRLSIDKIKSLNADYEYIFHDDQEAESWIKKNTDSSILRAYQNLIPTAFKADLWRYCVLYEYGGVYIDCKMNEMIPLREVIRSEDEYIVVEDLCSGKNNLYNAFIAITEKHQFLLKVIEECISNIKNHYYGHGFFDITGPAVFAKKYIDFFNIKIESCFEANFQIWKHYAPEESLCDLSKYPIINFDKKIIFFKEPPGYSHEDYGKLWNERHIYKE